MRKLSLRTVRSLNSGRVKRMTYKIDIFRYLHVCSALLGNNGHGASGVVFEWASTIKSPWLRTATSRYVSLLWPSMLQDVESQNTSRKPMHYITNASQICWSSFEELSVSAALAEWVERTSPFCRSWDSNPWVLTLVELFMRLRCKCISWAAKLTQYWINSLTQHKCKRSKGDTALCAGFPCELSGLWILVESGQVKPMTYKIDIFHYLACLFSIIGK